MAEMYAVSGETLTEIADAIRSKSGSDEFMPVASMAGAIEALDEHATYLGELVGRVVAGNQYGELELPLPKAGETHARVAVSTEAPTYENVNFILVGSKASVNSGILHQLTIVTRYGITALAVRAENITPQNTTVIAGANTRPYSENTRFKYYEIL